MPLYEYVCGRCSEHFEEIVYAHTTPPVCPSCGQPDEVERIPFSRVMFGKKEDLRPPDIKAIRRR
jgi:putative FmdB family regulatory protein